MVENAGEAKQRTELQLKKEKLIQAAAKFTRLVEEYRSEEHPDDAHIYGNDNELQNGHGMYEETHYQPPSARSPSPNIGGDI
jgi:hypothetical protein